MLADRWDKRRKSEASTRVDKLRPATADDPLHAVRHLGGGCASRARALQSRAGRVHACVEQGRKLAPAMPRCLAKKAAHRRAIHSPGANRARAEQPGSAAQARGGNLAPAPEIFPAHLYRSHRVPCKERKEVTISALAGTLMWLLIIAAAIFYVAGMQLGDEAPWALALCDDARNFCQHPEWSGIPAALMALVYFSLRGMEV